MRKRISYGLLLGVIPVLMLVLDHTFRTRHFFSALVVVMCFLAWLEYSLMALPGRRSWLVAGAVAVAACGATVWFSTDGGGSVLRSAIVPAVMFGALAWAAFTWDDTKTAFSRAVLWGFGILYVGYFPAYLLQLRALEHGGSIVPLLIVAVKVGDSGAYFTGRALGRHRFFPVSPRKTAEGAAGGLITTCLTAWIGIRFFPPEANFSDAAVLVAAAVVSCVAQAGDLIESMLKRSCGVKDSASVIPELGGILDMIDSLIFAAPALYYLTLWYGTGH